MATSDAVRAIASALTVAAQPDAGYASQQAAHATIVTELRRLGLDSGTAHVLADRSQKTGLPAATPLTPATRAAHGRAAVTRAAYLVGAAHRLTGKTGLARLDQQTAERRFLTAHVNAQQQREQGALRLDAAAAAYGDELGWYAQLDGRTTPECRAADGHNFHADHPPAIGYPGAGPHVGCRCRPGPAHTGAKSVDEATRPAIVAATREVSAVDTIELVSSRAYPGLERAPGRRDNWVEKAGGLPSYIERIAKHLHYEQGMTISHAIAAAVNTVKRWARGGGDVKPDTQAKAAKALASWEAKKVRAHAHTRTGPAVELARQDGSTPVRGSGDGPRVTRNATSRTGRGNTTTRLDAASRRRAAKSGAAMGDGSFPIRNVADLRRAVLAYGRAAPEKRDRVRAHIKRRARALGAAHSIPDGWQ